MALDGIQPLEPRHLLVDRRPHDLPRRRWLAISQGLLDQSHAHMGSSARSLPITSESVTSKQPRVQVDAIQVGLAPHSLDGVMFGTFKVDSLHQPLIRVGIVARQGWSPWESLDVSRDWTVVWLAKDSPMELTSSRVSFDSLSLQFFIRSQVSLILTNSLVLLHFGGTQPAPYFWPLA
jgi:hypothetical protein